MPVAPVASAPVSSAVGSPWDEDPSVPPVQEKAPFVTGTLEPNSSAQVAESAPFNVPENIEEKVGQKVSAGQYITPKPASPLENIFSPEEADTNMIPTNPVGAPATAVSPNGTPPIQKKSSFISRLFSKKPGTNQLANPANVAVPKKSRFGFAFLQNQKLIAVLGVIAFLSFVVALTELGLISIGAEKIYGAMGIERFWGGLPSNPENALTKSALTMQKHPNFKISGQIKLSVDTSIQSPITSPLFAVLEKNYIAKKDSSVAASEPARETAVFYTDNSNSSSDLNSNSDTVDPYNLYSNSNTNSDGAASDLGSDLNSTMDATTDTTDTDTNFNSNDSSVSNSTTDTSTSETSNIQDITSSIALKTGSEGISADITPQDYSESSAINLMLKDGNLLVKSNSIKFADNADPNKWLSYGISKVKGKVVQKDIFGLSSDGGFSVKGKRDANEKVGSTRCYRYKIDSIEIGNALSGIGITSDMVQNVSGNIWIGINDKLIRKVNLKIITPISSSVSSIVVNLEFSDFDAENKLSFPDESEIIEPTALTGTTAAATSAAATPIERDAKRKTDVGAILDALRIYKNATGSYPVSKDLLKLNSAGNMIEQIVVPKYLTALPTDPTDGWYYAYKSNDGTNCSLSARLENAADIEGQTIGSVFLYLKYNNN